MRTWRAGIAWDARGEGSRGLWDPRVLSSVGKTVEWTWGVAAGGEVVGLVGGTDEPARGFAGGGEGVRGLCAQSGRGGVGRGAGGLEVGGGVPACGTGRQTEGWAAVGGTRGPGWPDCAVGPGRGGEGGCFCSRLTLRLCLRFLITALTEARYCHQGGRTVAPGQHGRRGLHDTECPEVFGALLAFRRPSPPDICVATLVVGRSHGACSLRERAGPGVSIGLGRLLTACPARGHGAGPQGREGVGALCAEEAAFSPFPPCS